MTKCPAPTKVRRTLYEDSSVRLISISTLPRFTFTEKGTYSTLDTNASSVVLEIKTRDRMDYRTTSLFITDLSLGRIVAGFDEVISWFSDPSKKDMFYVNQDTGQLVFNAEYNSLKREAYDSSRPARKLTIMPMCAENREHKLVEGISMHVEGNLAALAMMPLRNFVNLRFALSRVDFDREPIIAFSTARAAIQFGMVTPSQSTANKAEAVVQGNTTANYQAIKPEFDLK